MEKQIEVPKNLGGFDLVAEVISLGWCPYVQKYKDIFEHIIIDLGLADRSSGGTRDKEENFNGYYLKIKTLFPPKSAGVWSISITPKTGETFSCVLKGPIGRAETRDHLCSFLKNRKCRKAIENFLPRFYGIIYGWQVAEHLYGYENRGSKNELAPHLENDEKFRNKYAKEIFQLYYLTASNDLGFCDVPQFVETLDIGNYIVDPVTANIKLIEYGNLYVDEVSSPDQKIAYELMRTLTVLYEWELYGQYKIDAPLKEGATHEEITEWLNLEPISMSVPNEKIDLIFQVFKHTLNKISSEELKIPQAKFEPDFIRSIQENEIEKFALAISNNVFLIKEENFKFEGVCVPGYYSG